MKKIRRKKYTNTQLWQQVYIINIIQKLRKCEKMLGQIRKDAQPESEADQKTCKNISIKLALDIQ